uniref:Cyanobacterial aminoacyl-tRNA synthetase CAAD domain-containing protein n=1 Tax=Davidia involucrata TaxID=16924 RepID=A0A5B7C8M8_DAVIN
MASIVANLPPPLLVNGRRPLLRTLRKFTVSAIGERELRVAVVAKATGESSESSTSLSVVQSVQDVWDKSEDRFALIGLGFAAIVALWASANLITAIDKLPLIPSALEFIGILFSSVSIVNIYATMLYLTAGKTTGAVGLEAKGTLKSYDHLFSPN